MRALGDGVLDAVVTDPPYPEIQRSYGRMTEDAWFELMRACTEEIMRAVRPSGSAVFVLRPNSVHPGQMRLWVWEFLLWAARRWTLVQDVYWWNFTCLPTVHTRRDVGLLRPSVSMCVWIAHSAGCFRDQSAVLWDPSSSIKSVKASDRALRYSPSGSHTRMGRLAQTVAERGGSTPFNLIPIPNSNSSRSSGSYGHGAGTPLELMSWWVRYIVPVGGLVADPFVGAGTLPAAASMLGRRWLCCDADPSYVDAARSRLSQRSLWDVT